MTWDEDRYHKLVRDSEGLVEEREIRAGKCGLVRDLYFARGQKDYRRYYWQPWDGPFRVRVPWIVWAMFS